MMTEVDPPSYDSVTVALPPLAPSVNLGFASDEDLSVTEKQPTSPIVESGNVPAVQRLPPTSFPPLKDSEIKRACHYYVAERCCYGSGFIDNMTILDVSDRIAYHYTLESYGEKRETAEQTKPYYGGDVDCPERGESVGPWDIQVTPPANFKKEKKIVELPHTSSVKSCGKCSGNGTTTCMWCLGLGGRGCLLCISDKKYRPCTSCKYSGRRCLFCEGRGTQKCKTCDGQGKLRTYKILIVTWTNHVEHFYSDTMSLPLEEIEQASGRQILTEEAQELSPVWNVPNASVITASASLINKHRAGLRNEAIRRQRHSLHAVPFTQVKYQWREDIGEFYVYGLQKKAYFENYPQQCCCCCNVM